ncbi:hypothetical protein PC120_g10359 [Phytophthora cactorum]|nr:hypothetical protein PC120_g10359 [Phytophthora cactorum]
MAFDDNPDFRYLWEERLSKDLTNDFADIEASHMASVGNFWVATATQDESTKIVGNIGLQRRSESEGEKKQALEFYAALGYTKGDELMRFWENPQFFEVDKIVKQL